MSGRNFAHVTPSMLRWARESAHISLADAARKLSLDEARLEKWETGDEKPTVSQARKLAQIYHRPLAVFFLPAPPDGYDVIREYRRLPGIFPGDEPSELRFAIRLAEERREAALEVLADLGSRPKTFELRTSLSVPVDEAAGHLRQALGIPLDEQKHWHSPSSALREWRSSLENLGVLVFQIPGLDLSLLRAICVLHRPLPVILLNTKDAPAGRVFSLMHEFVHLCLTNGGHVVGDSERVREPERQPTEVFANAVAAALLIPADALLSEPEVRDNAGDVDWDEGILKRLANRYAVSCETLLRRMATLNLASPEFYLEMRAKWLSLEGQKNAPQSVVPPHIKVLSHLGRGYASLVLEGYHQSVVTLSQVSEMLGTKIKHLKKIENDLRVGGNSHFEVEVAS